MYSYFFQLMKHKWLCHFLISLYYHVAKIVAFEYPQFMNVYGWTKLGNGDEQIMWFSK